MLLFNVGNILSYYVSYLSLFSGYLELTRAAALPGTRYCSSITTDPDVRPSHCSKAL